MKYFTDQEVEGLDPVLCTMLDEARHLAGFAFKITSGKRTPEQNAGTGGVSDSAHLMGLAVDIATPQDAHLREKMCWALGRVGFRRVFMYTRHAHADVDANKAQDVMEYLGESK